MKQLWILAGGNGAGKSTFYDRFLRPHGLSFVNADMIAKTLAEQVSPEVSKHAQEESMKVCLEKLKNGETFCFETVFSHESKLGLISKAKELGYSVTLVFIHLNHSTLNKARVIQRVNEGGHNVPPDRIESRIPRSLENIHKAIKIVDEVTLVDNSSGQNPFVRVATVKNNAVTEFVKPLPQWAQNILDPALPW